MARSYTLRDMPDQLWREIKAASAYEGISIKAWILEAAKIRLENERILSADNMIFKIRNKLEDLRDSRVHRISDQAREQALQGCVEAERGIQNKDVEQASRPLYNAAAAYLPDYAGTAQQLIELGNQAADTVEAMR